MQAKVVNAGITYLEEKSDKILRTHFNNEQTVEVTIRKGMTDQDVAREFRRAADDIEAMRDQHVA